MDAVLQIAVLLAAVAGSPDGSYMPAVTVERTAAASGEVIATSSPPVLTQTTAMQPPITSVLTQTTAMQPPITVMQPLHIPHQAPVDSWTSEDKFRHAAASWAAMVFTYAAASAIAEDHDTALAIALPVTASLGIAKEIVDRRRGGPFSFRDLTADALGIAAAWFFLREVR